MKTILLLLTFCMLSCSKNSGDPKKCYECDAIGAGNFYHEEVCTNGSPYDELPESYPNSNGRVAWTCTER